MAHLGRAVQLKRGPAMSWKVFIAGYSDNSFAEGFFEYFHRLRSF
jgi:hypothetical protein